MKFSKFFCVLLLAPFLFAPLSFAEPLASLSSNKAEYAVGESAVLRASLATKPADENYELDLISTLNEESLPTERTTDFQMFATALNLAAGSHTWAVTVVLQDKRYARDLKASLNYFNAKIAEIDEALATETDPVEIARLQERRARYLSLHEAATAELSNHRTAVAGPFTHTFNAL